MGQSPRQSTTGYNGQASIILNRSTYKMNEGVNHGFNIFSCHQLALELAHKIPRHLDLRNIGKLLLVDSNSKREVESILDYLVLREHIYDTYMFHQIRVSSYYRLFLRPQCVISKRCSHP